jgi:hypothetical protein
LCPPPGGYEPNELLPIIRDSPRDIFFEELLSSFVIPIRPCELFLTFPVLSGFIPPLPLNN